jgi:signal transduction histidine kinase
MRVRALIVDDSADDADLIRLALETAGWDVASARVDSEPAMADALGTAEWDVALCDHRMPGFGSRQALELIARLGVVLPTIVVSTAIGEEATVAALRAGAVDFVSKDRLVRLGPAVGRVLAQAAADAERDRLERALARSRLAEAIGELAGGVAHEFNNQLMVILGLTQILAARHAPEAQSVEDLRQVRLAAEHCAGLAVDLLSFARRRMLAIEPVAVTNVLERVARVVGAGWGDLMAIAVQDHTEGARVLADERALEQALLAVAVNGREAMPTGGHLTFAAQAETVTAAGGESRDIVAISVTDTGVGMLKEVQSRLFEPFFTTKEVGESRGLGLAAVAGVLEQMDGQITIASQPGRGTTAVIELPRATRDSSETDAPAPDPAPAPRPLSDPPQDDQTDDPATDGRPRRPTESYSTSPTSSNAIAARI